MGKTVKIDFDCGKYGRVTWYAPREAYDPRARDVDIQRSAKRGLQTHVALFFGLIHTLMKFEEKIREEGLNEIFSNLLAIGKRTVYRAGGRM